MISAAGNVEHDRIVELAQAACASKLPAGTAATASVREAAPAAEAPRLGFHQKETEQYHLCVGGRGINRGDDRRFILRVLDTILGGSTSSRLFQEVREKRGLAYSVYSYSSPYVDAGKVAIYVGTRPDNVGEALDVIGSELRRLEQDGVTPDELTRAKENVKGRTVLSMESTMARMNRMLSGLLTNVPLLTIDEMIAAVDDVTSEQISELVGEIYRPDGMSVAGVGADEDVFRKAAASVNPELLAA